MRKIIWQNASDAVEERKRNQDKNFRKFNPGLAIIGLGTTGPRLANNNNYKHVDQIKYWRKSGACLPKAD